MTQVETTVPGLSLTPCWSCKGPVDPRALFCSTCGAVQPPGNADHFTRLGLHRGYGVASADLDRQYFGFQRRLHPDRFATRTPKERALSQLQATALNEAYETLKDPMRRAAYLLRLAGRSVDIEQSSTVTDPVLLMEAMEMREALDEAETAEEVVELIKKADSDVAACQADIAKSFAANDLDAAGAQTTRLKYLSKLAEEARSRRIRMTRPGL